jgi:hypothetical protein
LDIYCLHKNKQEEDCGASGNQPNPQAAKLLADSSDSWYTKKGSNLSEGSPEMDN